MSLMGNRQQAGSSHYFKRTGGADETCLLSPGNDSRVWSRGPADPDVKELLWVWR